MKKAIVAFALQEEVVPVSIPGFEVHTILTKITKVQAAFRLTKAIFELQPDFVLNVGTAGTLAYSVGDIFSATHFIDRDSAKQNFTSISSEVQTTPLLSLPSIVEGQVTTDAFIVNTGDDFVTAADVVNGAAVDMEAFAEALVCREMGIPFQSVKYITDKIGANSMKHWEDKLADARTALADYFKTYIG